MEPAGLADTDLRRSWRVIGAAIASMTAVGFAISLSLPLLSLVLEQRGYSPSIIGINTAVGGIPSLLMPLTVPYLVARFGTAQVAIVSLIAMAAVFPVFYFADSLWLWFPLRAFFYAAETVAFTVGEFWINALAPKGRRGFAIGVYGTVLSVGLAAGPATLSLVGADGLLPFLIGSAVFLAGTVPMLFVLDSNPRGLTRRPRTNVVGFVLLAPTALFAVMAYGAVESGALGLLPVYGLEVGLSDREGALLVSAVAIGNILAQLPLGMLADRFDRRALLLGCSLVGVLGALAMPLAGTNLWVLLVLLCIWGAGTGGLYSVGLTHLAARFTGTDLAAASSAFTMMYAVGMFAGPTMIGVGLDLWSPHGFVAAIVVLFGAYALLIAVRMVGARSD